MIIALAVLALGSLASPVAAGISHESASVPQTYGGGGGDGNDNPCGYWIIHLNEQLKPVFGQYFLEDGDYVADFQVGSDGLSYADAPVGTPIGVYDTPEKAKRAVQYLVDRKVCGGEG
jgi:hypothetical protein